jgi:hypothetical protein
LSLALSLVQAPFPSLSGALAQRLEVTAEAEVARLETAVAEVLTHSILVERLAMTTTEVELARLEMAIAEVLRATMEITAARETMARELAARRTRPRGTPGAAD